MKLIGMLDSPYVRRVAISLQLLGIGFEHQSLSVFSGFDEFQRINPLVKAPTLICDDGEVLIDSTLILQYAEAIAGNGRSLMPTEARRCGIRFALSDWRWPLARKACRSFTNASCGRPRKTVRAVG